MIIECSSDAGIGIDRDDVGGRGRGHSLGQLGDVREPMQARRKPWKMPWVPRVTMRAVLRESGDQVSR